MTARKPIDWTFDGHPIYAPTVDLPLPRYPASVAEHLPPTPCAVCCVGPVALQHDDAGYYRSCEACGSDYAGAAELALGRRPCRCGPDGCSDSACAGKVPEM